MTEYSIMSLQKDFIHLEMTVKEILFEERKSFILTVQNINNIIEN